MNIRYSLSLFIILVILLQACMPAPLPTSTEGDLSADDWCFSLSANDKITFYPIIKNAGTTDWASEKTGTYIIGVALNSTTYQSKTYTLEAKPYFQLKVGESRRLPNGITINFDKSPSAQYLLINIWHFSHSEDTNNTNDDNPGTNTYFSASDFGSQLADKQCK